MDAKLDWITVAVGLILSFAGTIVAWLLADARSKARIAFMDEKLTTLKNDQERMDTSCAGRLTAMEILIAKSDQERLEIRRITEKLDSSKASKEVVDGFRNEISSLKIDMDKRFDKLERLLERNHDDNS